MKLSSSSLAHASPWHYLLWRMLFLQALLFFAWQGTAALSWAEQAEGIQVAVVTGISNTWKVGFPTRHRVTITSGKPFRGTVELQTVDGDGSSVRYRDSGWIVECTENEPFSIEIIAKHGRSNRPIRIDIFDDQHKLLTQHALRDSERGTAIAANQPWLVGIGSPRLDLGQGAIKSAQGALVEFSLSEIDRADELPNHPAAYSGVDTILFSSSNHALNQSISKEQRQAMETYLRNGGQMVLTWGAGGPELANYSEFSNVLPGQLVSVAEGCEPGAIESLLGSQDQLDPLRCSVLKLNRGRIDVVTAASDRSKLPFIARWAYGTGSVVWMATELDCDEVLPWNTRPALLKYLLKEHWEKSEGRASKQSFQGYDDLAGQLNAMLDTFPNLRLGNLGHLVLIAVLFALCIGPLDYFLVSKGWKRPRWTWWTLGLASAGTMLTSYMLAQAWKPELPSINQLEFVDYDDQTQLLRGRGFIHAYAGRRGLYDFSSQHRSFASNRSAESPLLPNRIDWFGQPGKGLGGFDSNVTTQLGLPAYTIDAQSASSSEVIGLGFPAAGTKALQTEWTESIGSQNLLNGLGTVSGKDDLLQGSFANPLGVELENAILYFAGRAYTVPARIRPGEKVAISTSIPKDITRRLQRRAFVAGEEQGVEWNPGDTDSIERLAELVSFHRSAGGPSYTGLYHRYLSALEASDLLKLERAILFAQVSEPATSWTLRRNGIPLKAEGGKSRTVVRIVLTVENNSKNSLLMQNDSRLNIP